MVGTKRKYSAGSLWVTGLADEDKEETRDRIGPLASEQTSKKMGKKSDEKVACPLFSPSF